MIAQATPPRDAAGDIVRPNGGRVYVYPGQLAISAAPCTMTTILGSCVTVCLTDPTRQIGGLNHYLLPRAPAGDTSLRFGDNAIPRLVQCLVRLGADPLRIVAKIAGGACVLDSYPCRHAHLGRKNAHLAIEALNKAGIPVVRMEIEGPLGRRIVFQPHTGQLAVTPIERKR